MQHETKSAILAKDMGPKMQQKKLWDQIETLTKVMRPKVHFGLYFIIFWVILKDDPLMVFNKI